jgi:hypothetical protein
MLATLNAGAAHRLDPHRMSGITHGSRTHLGLDKQCTQIREVSSAGARRFGTLGASITVMNVLHARSATYSW